MYDVTPRNPGESYLNSTGSSTTKTSTKGAILFDSTVKSLSSYSRIFFGQNYDPVQLDIKNKPLVIHMEIRTKQVNMLKHKICNPLSALNRILP